MYNDGPWYGETPMYKVWNANDFRKRSSLTNLAIDEYASLNVLRRIPAHSDLGL